MAKTKYRNACLILSERGKVRISGELERDERKKINIQ
jgi:hypothetical protein